MMINNRFGRLLAVLGVVFASSIVSMPAMSKCDFGEASRTGFADSIATGTGTGGTGIRDPKEGGTGTGGTGFAGGDGSGTGGTGFGDGDGTGTGGTGIFGVVTGFGSVCVNGLEVEYDSETLIRQDGRSATLSHLAVGQTVRIQTTQAQPLVAARIDVETALTGPIDRVDPAARRVWIMDQPVELRPGGIVFDHTTGKPTKLEELQPGAHLSVSGLRRADSVVAAFRLDQQAASERSVVTALVRDLGQGTAYVGETRTTFTKLDAIPDGSRDGQRLRVSGRWNVESRTLEAARIDDASTFAARTRKVSIQGFTAPTESGADFRIAGTTVEVSHAAAEKSVVNVDALVRIEGTIDDRGRLRADRVIVDTPGRHGHPLRSSANAVENRKDKEDRSSRSGREDRNDREDRGDRERGDRSGRPERSERPDRPERTDRSD